MTLDIDFFHCYLDFCFFLFCSLLFLFFIGYLFACKLDYFGKKKQRSELSKHREKTQEIQIKIDSIKSIIDEFGEKIKKKKSVRPATPYNWTLYNNFTKPLKIDTELSSMLTTETCQKIQSEITEILTQSSKKLHESEPTLQVCRKELFLHTVWAICWMLLKVQIIICIFGLFAVGAGILCKTIVTGNTPIACLCDSNGCIQATVFSYIGIIMWSVIALAALTFAIVFLQKVIKYFILQYDIIFCSCRMLTYILFSKKPDNEYLAEQFKELADTLRQKNSARMWDNIFNCDSEL